MATYPRHTHTTPLLPDGDLPPTHTARSFSRVPTLLAARKESAPAPAPASLLFFVKGWGCHTLTVGWRMNSELVRSVYPHVWTQGSAQGCPAAPEGAAVDD